MPSITGIANLLTIVIATLALTAVGAILLAEPGTVTCINPGDIKFWVCSSFNTYNQYHTACSYELSDVDTQDQSGGSPFNTN